MRIWEEAARGAGVTRHGKATWRRTWELLLPVIEQLESEGVVEASILGLIRSVTEGICARKRYQAALEARTAEPKKSVMGALFPGSRKRKKRG